MVTSMSFQSRHISNEPQKKDRNTTIQQVVVPKRKSSMVWSIGFTPNTRPMNTPEDRNKFMTQGINKNSL